MSKYTDFQKDVEEWENKTFPTSTAESILLHLNKEVKELTESHSPEEGADCFILLCHHANKCGYNLLEEAIKKMKINRKRKWGKPDKDGIIEHIKEEIN